MTETEIQQIATALDGYRDFRCISTRDHNRMIDAMTNPLTDPEPPYLNEIGYYRVDFATPEQATTFRMQVAARQPTNVHVTTDAVPFALVVMTRDENPYQR